MSWLLFTEVARPSRTKTKRWEVHNTRGDLLGRVMWLSGWRKYVFAPVFPTSFEEDCLRELASFVEARTREYRCNGVQKNT